MLRQNRLHQCVHHVMEIIRKIAACRFEQLRNHIFWQPWIASNKRILKMKWCVTQQLLVLWQNHLHQCVHHVMEIVRKIMVYWSWTTSWPYFSDSILTTWNGFAIAQAVREIWSYKSCTIQQLLVLWQNRLHQCVHHVMEIIRKIAACRFEQLRDLIFWQLHLNSIE